MNRHGSLLHIVTHPLNADGRAIDAIVIDHDMHREQNMGGGHDKHAGHSVAMFRDRFWLSLALTLPIVFFSEMIQEWFGYTAPTFPGSDWVAPILGTILFVYGGSPFLREPCGRREIVSPE